MSQLAVTTALSSLSSLLGLTPSSQASGASSGQAPTTTDSATQPAVPTRLAVGPNQRGILTDVLRREVCDSSRTSLNHLVRLRGSLPRRPISPRIA